MRLSMCSCGRAQVEAGCDLCVFCRGDHEEAQMHREQEKAYYAEQEDDYDAYLRQAVDR